MRAALVTLLPMLTAGMLVMFGGERMARRETEHRTPADRDRLMDLSEAFRSELGRLDGLFLDHLDRVGRSALYLKPDETESLAEEIAGIRLIRVFRERGNDLSIQPGSNKDRLPEVELVNRKRPLDLSTAVMIEPGLLEKELPRGGVWLETKRKELRIHCRQPEPGTLVAFVIEVPLVKARVGNHLASWLDKPMTPLREAGENLRVGEVGSEPILSLGSGHVGPAAAIIPTRSICGDWEIRAWDGLTLARSHDPAVLAVATTIALLLAAAGFVLHAQQKRALKLAAERVSFVNQVSHELGTPLTNIGLNLDLARESLNTRPAEARHRLSLVAEEIERLSRLVANVLTFSRRERDTLSLKPVRCVPSDVIANALESFRPSLQRRGIEIESQLSSDSPVLLDPDALSQIVGNLISNVEKHAASGRWLRLSSRLDHGFLELEVRDRGPGIPAAARERIFEPFERVLQSTNEGSSGTGLGLAIGRDLARRMGGELEVLDRAAGSAFRLRVPAPAALAIVSATDAA